jgi:hypothetical protein
VTRILRSRNSLAHPVSAVGHVRRVEDGGVGDVAMNRDQTAAEFRYGAVEFGPSAPVIKM